MNDAILARIRITAALAITLMLASCVDKEGNLTGPAIISSPDGRKFFVGIGINFPIRAYDYYPDPVNGCETLSSSTGVDAEHAYISGIECSTHKESR